MTSPPRPDDDPRPEPPERPDDDACCQSGCDPCIFDLYSAEMDHWRAELAAWEKRQTAARKPGKRTASEAGDETARATRANAPAGRGAAAQRPAGEAAPMPRRKTNA